VVIEVTAGGQRGAAWNRAVASRALKNGWKGGRFLSLDFGPAEVKTAFHMADFVGSLIWRGLFTFFWPFIPRYHAVLVFPDVPLFKRVFSLVESGALRIVIDPASPFPFTTEGVRAAFRLQSSSRAHGRVVVRVAEE
jgi:NADPH:quinone reductase-like Zn-dependent oxidoreductase